MAIRHMNNSVRAIYNLALYYDLCVLVAVARSTFSFKQRSTLEKLLICKQMTKTDKGSRSYLESFQVFFFCLLDWQLS